MYHELAATLKLPTRKTPTVRVIVGNGKQLEFPGLYLQVMLHLSQTAFLVDFFIIPLVRFGAILGVTCLSTLGPITWDFKNMLMQFTHDTNQIMLKAVAEFGILIIRFSYY